MQCRDKVGAKYLGMVGALITGQPRARSGQGPGKKQGWGKVGARLGQNVGARSGQKARTFKLNL